MQQVIEKELCPGIRAVITLELSDETAGLRFRQMQYILGMFEDMAEDLSKVDPKGKFIEIR